MLKLFRTNHLVTGILLVFYAVLIRSAVFIIHPSEVIPDTTGILSSFIYNIIGTTGLFPDILSISCIFINALIINYLVAHNFLSKEINLFPGLFYIIISSCVPDFLSFSAIHLANTFLILALFSLFAMDKKSESAKKVFNAGLLIGISTLFSFSYWIFFLWFIIAISLLQSFRLKPILMGTIGFSLPWFYTFLHQYWIGNTTDFFINHVNNQFDFFAFNFGSSLLDYIPLVLLPILFVLVLIRFNQNFIKQKFEVKKKISLLYWLLFFGILYLFTGTATTPEHLIVFTVPIGILFSFSITRLKNPFDLVAHIILLFFVVLVQYIVFLKVI